MDCGGVGSPAGPSNLFGELETTIRLTHDIFCNRCNDWAHCFVSTKPEIRQAQRMAKDLGWKRVRSREGRLIDICPGCQEEKEKDV